ncbi:MAG: hypothetical protein H0W62_14345 [Chitinophagales bacterium]|nr:hypothetical protein [Chitinophagales bacterium]
MKKTLLILVAPVCIFISCKNNSIQTTDEENPEKTISDKTNQCYAYTANKDSVFLHISITDTIVTGDLTYKLFEKDQNKGTLQGMMKGDTLIAEYKFLSEGTESIREVAFLKRGNDFVEGYGDVEGNNGKMVFKNTSTLNFNNNMILKEVDCEK